MTLKIAGVPERFFGGIKDQLIVCRGGTGEMIEKLNNKELDGAIGLTEGFIKNGTFPIIGQFTVNPITWMICGRKTIRTLGISRYGSGSELMGHLLMKREKTKFKFVESFHLEGLLKDMRSGKIDGFLWEWYTTLPLVKENEIQGSIDSPWPAFMIACRPDILANNKNELQELLDKWTVINKGYLLSKKDDKEFDLVNFPKHHADIDKKALEHCSTILKDLGLITTDHRYLVADLKE